MHTLKEKKLKMSTKLDSYSKLEDPYKKANKDVADKKLFEQERGKPKKAPMPGGDRTEGIIPPGR